MYIVIVKPSGIVAGPFASWQEAWNWAATISNDYETFIEPVCDSDLVKQRLEEDKG